jgi:hypothetical protein
MLEETNVVYHGIEETVYLELEDEDNFHTPSVDVNKYLKAGILVCFTILSLYLLLVLARTSQPIVETKQTVIVPSINTTTSTSTPMPLVSSTIEPWKDCFYRLNWCSPLMNVGTGNGVKEVKVSCREGYTNILDCKTLKLRW